MENNLRDGLVVHFQIFALNFTYVLTLGWYRTYSLLWLNSRHSIAPEMSREIFLPAILNAVNEPYMTGDLFK